MHIDNVIFLILSKNAYTKFSEGPRYILFYNHDRIQYKTGVAPLTLRHFS